MSSQPRRDQTSDSDSLSPESAELEQQPAPESLPKGAAQQSATGTGSIKVSG